MSDKFFLDTNIFVYAIEDYPEKKANIATNLIERGIETGAGVISLQVAQETLNVVTRKARVTLPLEDTKLLLRDTLQPLCTIFPSFALLHHGMELQSRYGFSFYDSLIVGAALEAECALLYSEDLQDGQKIAGLEVRNPFKVAAAS
jgi:predicted nucleic acid-binding protein